MSTTQKTNRRRSDDPYSHSPRRATPNPARTAYVQSSVLKATQGACSMTNSPTNHGEGNPQAAEEFNKAERKFVDSPEGKKKIDKGPQVRPGEEAELRRAEERAKSHAKHDDSNTTRMKD
jgi:hypothetical protein